MIETVKMFQVNKGVSRVAGQTPKCLNMKIRSIDSLIFSVWIKL